MKTRQTQQKETIQREIDKFNSFFTGEEVYIKLKKNNQNIGKATVYRFLKDLRNKKMIHSYNCNRNILYSKNEKSHCHFICEKCGKSEHIYIKNIDFLKQNIQRDICHFQLDIYGLCSLCKSNKGEN